MYLLKFSANIVRDVHFGKFFHYFFFCAWIYSDAVCDANVMLGRKMYSFRFVWKLLLLWGWSNRMDGWISIWIWIHMQTFSFLMAYIFIIIIVFRSIMKRCETSIQNEICNTTSASIYVEKWKFYLNHSRAPSCSNRKPEK